jgi:hypothetical protein
MHRSYNFEIQAHVHNTARNRGVLERSSKRMWFVSRLGGGRKKCWRCAQPRQLHRCHIVPRSLDGSESPSNLVLLCSQCHAEAPNVADQEFMWTWLRADAVALYGTYWYLRGFREYEFIYGKKPLAELPQQESLLPRLHAATGKYIKNTSTHWGQGKLNPSTMAWLIRQIEIEAANNI